MIRTFCSGAFVKVDTISKMVFNWYLFINRALHDRLEIRNFSSCVENIYLICCAHSGNIFSTLEEKFCISAWPCDILYVLLNFLSLFYLLEISGIFHNVVHVKDCHLTQFTVTTIGLPMMHVHILLTHFIPAVSPVS